MIDINQIMLMAPQGGDKGGGMSMFVPLLMMVVVVYFFMIAPQRKRQKKMQAFRDEVTKGTHIVTTGGIHGKIVGIDDQTFVIETEGHSKLRIQKSSVSLELTQALSSGKSDE